MLENNPFNDSTGSSTDQSPFEATQQYGNEAVTQREVDSDFDTLEEPVYSTIGRDLAAVGRKLLFVLFPVNCGSRPQLADWDLWGPLLICIYLAIALAIMANKDNDASQVFAAVFVIIWLGSGVVTLNGMLLGSEKLGFFQNVCALGYSIAPLAIATLPRVIKSDFDGKINSIIIGLALAWSLIASTAFLAPLAHPERKALVLFPVFLFYAAVAWIIWSI